MKKLAYISSFFIAILIILSIAVSAYFKPAATSLIETQLANYGYDKAIIGDISVGLYKTTISNIELNNKKNTKIGELSVSYWPQQILSKRIDTITIKDSNIDVQVKANGDILVADYPVFNLFKNELLIQKTDYYNQSGFSLIKKAHAASPAAAPLPFNAVEAKNLSLALTGPTGKTINSTISALFKPDTNSASGEFALPATNLKALQDLLATIKPDLAYLVNDVSGTVSTNLGFDIADITNLDKIGGSGRVEVKNLSLKKDDITLSNLNTALEIENLLPLSTKNSQKVTIDSISKAFLTTQNISAQFGLTDNTKLNLDNAFVNLSGGSISADAFSADLTNINSVINLTLQSIDLAELSELLGLGLNLKGKIDATIPLKIQNNKIVLDQATINTLLSSAIGQRTQERVDNFLDDQLGKVLGNDSSQENKDAGKKVVKDVLNNLLGGF